MERFKQLKEGKGTNHILPFLWMHGEPHEMLKEEIDKIEDCGIREICLESRPHPDYCGKQWWDDLDFIIGEAKKRGMRIWILDDDKFPTGHANGAFANKPELTKLYLAERHMDIVGPVREGAVLVEPFLGTDGRLISIFACPKPDTETLAVEREGIIDLTDCLHNGFVYFNLPKGRYRLFVLFTTRKGGGRPSYINLIDSKSVRVLIDEVYEKHYARYSEEFGKTLAGFFSDEPELGNTPGYCFEDKLGKRDVKLPWSEELEEALKEKWGEGFPSNLPALWYEYGQDTAIIRGQYMDEVTKLVETCFSRQIGTWCKVHGVEYIGHIIEDDNAHTRLGCSIGHYFRGQKGQHMSGIDVVHHQIVPGFQEKIHQWIAGDSDGEFFHYGLAKMCASYAHIDKEKKGRALCEIFGNYGWAEGVSFMKWLTDHMLVRGINTFVPHAFSPLFPDKDCPPHFYARGNNPQYRHFAYLMHYMNRMSHLLSEGTHIAEALVLYHAESEWSGGKTQFFQKPVRALMEQQLDCDIISADLLQTVEIKGKQLIIGENRYNCLITPYCEYLPRNVAEFIKVIAKRGIKVYMIGEYPIADTEKKEFDFQMSDYVDVVTLSELARRIRKDLPYELVCRESYPDLRSFAYKHMDGKLYMFFNESLDTVVDTKIYIQDGSYEAVTQYNALVDKAETYAIEKNTISLMLKPGESAIYLLEEGVASTVREKEWVSKEAIDADYRVSLSEAHEYPLFEDKLVIYRGEKLPNMNGKGYFPSFVGTYRYETEWNITRGKEEIYLYLPRIGDTAEVFINGRPAGMVISDHGLVEITDFVRDGINQVIIEVTNTLVWKIKDGASTHLQVQATGMLETPEIWRRH